MRGLQQGLGKGCEKNEKGYAKSFINIQNLKIHILSHGEQPRVLPMPSPKLQLHGTHVESLFTNYS